MLLESILRKTQRELKRALFVELKKCGYSPLNRKGFLYAKGDLPVLLVAHLDTVHERRVRTICYSRDGKILMSPEGIGGDDRAGVFMILQLIKRHKCHVLFCEDEEHGGIGARLFTQSGITPSVNYIVELDRRGAADAVFYECANQEFAEFVCQFGFIEDIGSFSDISVIAPSLGIAAVNISSGYYNEHTLHEYINLSEINKNLERLDKMLSTKTSVFEYVEMFSMYDGYWNSCLLSPLGEGDYIVDEKGRMVENEDSTFWVDRSGAPYYVLEDYPEAVRIYGASAYTKENLPVRFNEDAAMPFDILI